jgi:hypothetical protein
VTAYPFIAAPIPVAAQAVGFSESTLKVAIKDGELPVHYRGTKPVVRAEDLDEWVQSLPTAVRKPSTAA